MSNNDQRGDRSMPDTSLAIVQNTIDPVVEMYRQRLLAIQALTREELRLTADLVSVRKRWNGEAKAAEGDLFDTIESADYDEPGGSLQEIVKANKNLDQKRAWADREIEKAKVAFERVKAARVDLSLQNPPTDQTNLDFGPEAQPWCDSETASVIIDTVAVQTSTLDEQIADSEGDTAEVLTKRKNELDALAERLQEVGFTGTMAETPTDEDAKVPEDE